MSKELALLTPKLPRLGNIPLITQREEENSVSGNDGDVFIQFKGIMVLGIPYGFMYFKPVENKRRLRAVRRTTMLGNMPDLLSVTENSGIISQAKFDALMKDERFANVIIMAM
jgi:hypothetical protein